MGLPVKDHHIRPDLVQVYALAEVDHVRGVSPGGAHVHLQGYQLPLFAQAGVVPEELQVEAPAAHRKGSQHRLSRPLHIGTHPLVHVVEAIAALVGHVHDGVGGDVAGGEEHLPLAAAHPVIGDHLPLDVLLHEVGDRGELEEEVLQLPLVLQAIGVGGAHPPVGFDDHRPAHLGDEILGPG